MQIIIPVAFWQQIKLIVFGIMNEFHLPKAHNHEGSSVMVFKKNLLQASAA